MHHLTPPEALGLTSSRVTLPTGVELHYVEKGDPEGPVLIFLHGFADSWRSWELNLPLVAQRYHTYALSQRGHGDSSKPDCCYRPEDLAGDVMAFIDALGMKQATLIGHSMGSFITYTVALNQPEHLERLVLVGWGPPMPTDPAAVERVRKLNMYLQMLEGEIDPAFVRDFVTRTAFNPIPAPYLETLVAESLKVPVTVWKQMVANRLADLPNHSAGDSIPGRGIIKTPTLIVYGDQDPYVHEGTAVLASVIQHRTQITYQGTGHAPHWEWPRRFVEDLETFVI